MYKGFNARRTNRMSLVEQEQMNYDKKHWKKLDKEPVGGYNLKTFFRVLAIAKFRVSFKYLPRFFGRYGPVL